MAKKITVYSELYKSFQGTRDALKKRLKQQRECDLQEAFPELVDDEGKPLNKGQIITAKLSEFTRAFHDAQRERQEQIDSKITEQIVSLHKTDEQIVSLQS